MALVVTTQHMTLEQFVTWATHPARAEQRFEYWEGEVVELVSQSAASKLAAKISGYIFIYLQGNDIGELTGADGGYLVAGQAYIPDVAFIRYDRQTAPPAAYYPVPPDLAVEVVSPTDSERKLLLKVSTYLAAGTEVWVVYPDVREVHVHRPGKSATALSTDATLTSDLLPGFALPVSAIFPAEDAPASPQGT